MSGGVDSSVAAALLKKDGYDVVGVFIKVWQADFLPCNWREERREAMRAAAHLGIPFLTLDLEKAYKKEVVDYMIREYGAGRVPNPDVMCNKHVKFGAFLDFAKKHGADFIATGHYARIQSSVASCQLPVNTNAEGKASTSDWQLATGNYKLLSGADKEKDQSYFLWTLTQNELRHTLFPIGHLLKKDVRKLARKFGLPNADKKDSQGLCFMGKIDMQEFLQHYLKTTKGSVLNEKGDVVGDHEGAMLYTIGQRHGFRTHKKSTNEQPLFVIAKDIKHNTITVAYRDPHSATQTQQTLAVESVNNIYGNTWPSEISARVRYHGALHPIERITLEGRAGEMEIAFRRTIERVAPGQSVALYAGEVCLGGGIVST